MKAFGQSLLLGVSLTLLASRAVAGTLSLTPPGTLGGSTSTGTALNDNGYATGYSATSGGATHAFLYNPTTQAMTDLGVVSGQSSSMGYGINSSNEVVGVSGSDAFTDTSNVITSLGAGAARGVNDSGVVIGYNAAGTRTVEWSASGVPTSLFAPTPTEGLSINNAGYLVGANESDDGGYYSNGNNSNFNPPGTVIPNQINGSGIVSGQAATDSEAAIFNVSAMTETILGKLSPSDSSSTAYATNSSGVTVGTSGGAGFEWTSSGGMVSLTSLLAGQYSGWTIVSASAINDNGQILAEGSYNGGPDQAVILSLPTPEPPSFVLLGIAAVGLAFAALKRRCSAVRGHALLKPLGLCAFLLAASPLAAHAQAPKLLAPTGFIMWDYSGQHGDTILVTLKPAREDTNGQVILNVYLEPEWRLPGQPWQHLQLREAPGPSGIARIFPRNTDPVDVSLRIPAAVFGPPPALNHELRYRVRTVRQGLAPGSPGPIVDDFVIPGTITLVGGPLPATPFPVRPPATTPRPPQDPEKPRLVEFNLQAAPAGGAD